MGSEPSGTSRRVVCRLDELAPGDVRRVDGGRVPVVLVRAFDGQCHALQATCPHQGARLDRGNLDALTVGDEPGAYALSEEISVLRCPWHSFDFDVATGRCFSDARLRVRRFPVAVEDGDVIVELG